MQNYNSRIQYRYTFIPVCTIILIVTFLFILSACRAGNSDSLDQAQAASVKDSVNRLAANVQHDVSQEGPKAWLRYFDKSPDFFMASGGKLVFPNYDSAVTFVKWFASTGRSIKLTWSDLKIDPLSSDLAVLRAYWFEVITDSSGNRTPSEGYFTGIVKYTPVGWKFRNLHWSIAGQTD